MEITLTLFLFTALVATALAIVVLRNLFAAIMLASTFSLLSALLFTMMDAVDVALTEAAVGAGITTVLMLGTIALTKRQEKQNTTSILPLVAVVITSLMLIYGTLDMPNFGDANAPIHTHEQIDYIKRTPIDIHIPNVVTAVLASYRGFDTLGEVLVVFTAGLGVIVLIGGRGRKRQNKMPNKTPNKMPNKIKDKSK